jgi:carbon-monoxide dehydrogenase large subunit
MVLTEPYIGRALLRKEDAKLLAGQASYIDNQSMAGMAWISFVRPPYVHATIDGIDTSAAAAMPGVIGVFAHADLASEWAGSLPMVWPITEDIKMPVHWPLTGDTIRFAGDAVAVVVAETRGQAEDAAEAVLVEATPLDAVTDLDEASTDGVVIHPDLGTNNVVHWSHGGSGDQGVFDDAAVLVHERYVQPRLIPNAIEPRGCLAFGTPASGEFTLVSSTQIPHIARVGHSLVTGISQGKLRVIAPDVGGAFGSKLNVYAEEAVALTLARMLNRPIKWIESRSENYVATIHGRGTIHDCTLAGTPDGKILGMRFVELADMGA